MYKKTPVNKVDPSWRFKKNKKWNHNSNCSAAAPPLYKPDNKADTKSILDCGVFYKFSAKNILFKIPQKINYQTFMETQIYERNRCFSGKSDM